MLSGFSDEEQDAFDNMPESLQGSERGELMEETIDSLGEIIDSLDEVIERLSEIV